MGPLDHLTVQVDGPTGPSRSSHAERTVDSSPARRGAWPSLCVRLSPRRARTAARRCGVVSGPLADAPAHPLPQDGIADAAARHDRLDPPPHPAPLHASFSFMTAKLRSQVPLASATLWPARRRRPRGRPRRPPPVVQTCVTTCRSRTSVPGHESPKRCLARLARSARPLLGATAGTDKVVALTFETTAPPSTFTPEIPQTSSRGETSRRAFFIIGSEPAGTSTTPARARRWTSDRNHTWTPSTRPAPAPDCLQASSTARRRRDQEGDYLHPLPVPPALRAKSNAGSVRRSKRRRRDS